MEQPLVSVIVVNFNCEEFIEQCIESIVDQTYSNVETIVVDNCSTDKSLEILNKHKDKVRLINNSENLGFASANNRGIAESKGDYVLFLNPDAYLDKNFLENSISALIKDEKAASLAGKVLRFDEKTIDSAGQELRFSGRPKDRGFGEADVRQYEVPGKVFGACGAAALFRKVAIDNISVDGEFFDNSYFIYYEDVDINWRTHILGWKCLYEPTAIAYHYRGGTSEKSGRGPMIMYRPVLLQFHYLKNRYQTILKNETVAGILIRSPFILCHDLVLWVMFIFKSPVVLFRLLWDREWLSNALAWRKVINQKRSVL